MKKLIGFIKQIWENKVLIVTGIVNRLLSSKEIKEMAFKRLDMCKSCEFNSKNKKSIPYPVPYKHCTKCGCSLGIKPYVKESKCPDNRW